jgi:hypothetical protein
MGEFLSSGIELSNREKVVIYPTIQLVGSTTPANVYCKTDTVDIVAYVEINSVQPSTSGTGLLFLQDSGATFPTLDSDADPTVWGLLCLVRDADPLYPPIVEYLFAGGVTNTMTRRGVSTTGVTLNRNLAFSFSSAGSNLSGNNTYNLQLRITYKKLLGI